VSLIGIRPEEKSIDRIDSSGNYSCGNCEDCVDNKWLMNVRWATRVEQGRNRKACVIVSTDLGERCISEASENYGINRATVYARVRRGIQGDELFKPLTVPKKHTINGESKTLREWSEAAGVKLKTLQKRLSDGCSNEMLLAPINTKYSRKNYRISR